MKTHRRLDGPSLVTPGYEYQHFCISCCCGKNELLMVFVGAFPWRRQSDYIPAVVTEHMKMDHH